MRRAAFDRALADATADAFVHVGPPGDPLVHYLSGASLPCRAAVVYGGRVAVVPERALRERAALRNDVSVLDAASTPAERLPDLVADSVLAPRTLPHDAALYLDNAGVDVASTTAHEDARAVKTSEERDRIDAAQAVAATGMAAVGELLAAAEGEPLTAEGDSLMAEGTPLTAGRDPRPDESGVVTAERVCRTANAAMARAGATPLTVVGADGALASSEPVPVRVVPRVDGYHGLLARTFVADSAGGWERRATLACEYAVDAALDVVDPGETAVAAVETEVVAELGSYGFPPEAGTASVHGVGLERRESPTGDATIEPGAVLVVGAELDDDGRVWVADLGVVTDGAVERVGEFPRSVVPRVEY